MRILLEHLAYHDITVRIRLPHLPFVPALLASTLCMFVFSYGMGVSCGDAAQLRIRKELLNQQSDHAVIHVDGRFEHVKGITDQENCELKAALRSAEIRVAIIGEFINACSTRLDPTDVSELSRNGTIPIRGVFRVWFPSPLSIDDVFSEEFELEPYHDANPKHAIEIHPVIQVGKRTFHDTVRAMEKADFKVEGTATLQRLLKRKVTVQEYQADDGETYIAIESGGSLPNYFHLKAVLRSKPVKTEDGYVAVIDILDRQKVIVSKVRVFSIEGTKANEALPTIKRNSEFSFWGITRMDGKKILKALDEDTGYHVPIPIEFVLLDIHR